MKTAFTMPILSRLEYHIESKILAYLGEKKVPHTVGHAHYAITPHWQKILWYLWRAKVLSSPRFFMNPVAPDEPPLFSFFVPTGTIAPVSDGNDLSAYNRGSALRFEDALSKTIGELLERYPLIIYRNKDFVRASCRMFAREGQRFLDPESVMHLSAEQRASQNALFDRDSFFQWTAGTSLFDGSSVMLPAQMIFWNYRCDALEDGEPRLRESNTNGAGGYFTKTGAILSGLYELIQRDSFLVFWLNRIAPPQIDVASLASGPAAELIRRCKEHGLEIRLLNVTTELGVPAVVAVLASDSRYPRMNLGAGCALDPEKAVEQAVEEALTIRHWIQYRQTVAPEKTPSVSNVIQSAGFAEGQRKRIFFWSDPQRFRYFEFFLKGAIEPLAKLKERVPRARSEKEELACLVHILKTKGPNYEPFFYQATHNVLRELGYYSVRVIVPALLPMYMAERNAPLGAKRLREAPVILGYGVSQKTNPLPHPFP